MKREYCMKEGNGRSGHVIDTRKKKGGEEVELRENWGGGDWCRKMKPEEKSEIYMNRKRRRKVKGKGRYNEERERERENLKQE